MTFKVGDKVKIVPKTRFGWNSACLMEDTVGRVGVVVQVRYPAYDVTFSEYVHPFGQGAWWSYREDDLEKCRTFKGNK